MTTPLTNLFLKVTNTPEEVDYEDIEKAKNEYKGRMKLLDRNEKKKFDYLTSFLNDVRKTGQLDVAKHQYDKLVSETRTYNLQIEDENSQTTYYEIHGNATHSSIKNSQQQSAGQPSSASQSIQKQISKQQQQRQISNGEERNQRKANESSKQASYKMRKSNPNIADLSDTNRPTKIAERYSELYDNEWTEAFEDLTKNFEITETDSIKLLHQIITEAYKFVAEISDSQVLTLYNRLIAFMVTGLKDAVLESDKKPPEEDLNLLRQIRKGMAPGCIKDIQTNFKNERLPQIPKDCGDPGKELETINIFTEKCVEIAWWMCVQDPPVEMCENSVSTSVPDIPKYRAYTRSGNKIDFIVWPCILLYKGGPVLCKGVAQFK